MGIEGTEQRAKEGRVGDGEDEERGQTLGGQPIIVEMAYMIWK